MNPATEVPITTRTTRILHGLCEFALYAWIAGLALPHANALYNGGLVLSIVTLLPYLWLTRWRELLLLKSHLFAALLLFACWNLLSTTWSGQIALALNDWRGEMGIMLQMFIPYAVIFQQRASQRRFGLFIVLLALLAIGRYAQDWYRLSLADHVLIPAYPKLREWGGRLLLSFPFLMMAGKIADDRRIRMAGWFGALLLSILMFITAARGVWLALGTSLGLLLLVNIKNLKTVGLMAASCAIGFAILLSVPNNPLKARLDNLTYTNDRVLYTWTPAIKLWQQSPLHGIGFGKKTFHSGVAELANTDMEWQKSLGSVPRETLSWIINLGPHNNYLETLAAGGIIGAVLLAYFYGATLLALRQALATKCALCTAAGIGLIAKYMVHGMVESINWRAMAVLAGLLLAGHVTSRNSGKSA